MLKNINRLYPSNLKSFGGETSGSSTLFNLLESFEDHILLRNLLIVGKKGVGKKAAVSIFLRDVFDNFGMDMDDEEDVNQKISKFLCCFDGSNDQDISQRPVTDKLSNFLSKPHSKNIFPFQILLIQNAQLMPPSIQQIIRRGWESGSQLRMIIVTESTKQIVGSFSSKCVLVEFDAIQEMDGLRVVMPLIKKERVGYTIEGLKKALEIVRKKTFVRSGSSKKRNKSKKLNHGNKRHRLIDFSAIQGKGHLDMSLFISSLQQTFIQHSYLSEENIDKHSNLSIQSRIPTVPYYQALVPVERCEICTLIPPCSHINEEDLVQRAEERRIELPKYEGGLTCRNYLEHGCCRIYNEFGHCSLNHPTNLHPLIPPTVRCQLCTLPFPCDICPYSQIRELLVELVSKMIVVGDVVERIQRERGPILSGEDELNMEQDWDNDNNEEKEDDVEELEEKEEEKEEEEEKDEEESFVVLIDSKYEDLLEDAVRHTNILDFQKRMDTTTLWANNSTNTNFDEYRHKVRFLKKHFRFIHRCVEFKESKR